MLAQEMRERSAPPDTDGPDGGGDDEDGFTGPAGAAGRAFPRARGSWTGT